MNLIAKFILAISVLLVGIMAPIAYLNIQWVQNLLYEEAALEADTISETIIKTTHYQMLEDDRARVYQMIQEAGKQKGIEHIRMITKEGTVIFSTDREEIGTTFDKSAAACDMCHSGEKPLTEVPTMNRSRVFRNERGVEVLGLTKAIYNQPSCTVAACHVHPPDQEILGVLDTIVSLKRMRVQTGYYTTRLALLTVAMLMVIGTSLTLLVQRLVNRPIRELLRHTKQVGELHLDATLEPRSRDEIGDLAGSFNDMTVKLRVARQELEDWARTLEVKVSERTRELQKMQAQLIRSEKLASLGEIVAGIAHELNNPLTGILVLSSLLERDPKLDGTLKDDLTTIVRESQRCARIVKGLLDFARESPPTKSASELRRIMDNSLSLIGTQSLFHNVEIVKRYEEGLPEVHVDPNQMEQVFINILLNAAQAMPDGGILGIGIRADQDAVVVSISDTGCGIPPEHLDRIFDPFFTTKESRGTGLGLSVSYGIVENHGGTIAVESRVGEGTTFSIRLPVSATDTEEEA